MVFPIAGYWLGMAALTHAVILVGRGEAAEWGEPSASELSEPSASEEEPPATHYEPAIEPAPLPAPPEPEPAPVAAAPPSALAEPAVSEPEEEEAGPSLGAPPPPPREPRRAEAAPRAPLVAAVEDPVERDEPPRRVPEPEAPTPTSRDSVPISSGLPSCEAVLQASTQSMDFEGARSRTPDLPDEAFSRVLNHGGYLSGCSIPDGTALDICVAVQAGQVRGVSVAAHPPSAAVSGCVARAVARLRFPHSPRLDVARTHFDALR